MCSALHKLHPLVQEDGVAGVDWNAPETLPPWLDILQKVPRHIPVRTSARPKQQKAVRVCITAS